MDSIDSIWKHLTTGSLSKAILDLSPVDYEFWFSTAEYKRVLLGVTRELLTRFLAATSTRPKNMELLSDAKLSQPYIEFFRPSNNAKQTHAQRQEHSAMRYFYRSFIAVLRAYMNDACFLFEAMEFSPKFLSSTCLNELESSFFHYITWIEVNQCDNDSYMAVRVIQYYHAERRCFKFDRLGLLTLYQRVLEFLWNRPLQQDDFGLLNAITVHRPGTGSGSD